MSTGIRKGLAAGVAVLAVGLAGCQASGGGGGPTEGDPREGVVKVEGTDVRKVCDGTTLVYYRRDHRGGVAVVPDAPECQPR